MILKTHANLEKSHARSKIKHMSKRVEILTYLKDFFFLLYSNRTSPRSPPLMKKMMKCE